VTGPAGAALEYQPTPRVVRIASVLCWTAFVIQCLVSLLSIHYGAVTALVNAAFAAAIMLTTLSFGGGRGAARWVLIAVCVVTWKFWVRSGGGSLAEPVNLVIDGVRFGPLAAAAVLLCLPAANRWFAWQQESRELVDRAVDRPRRGS
jgi:hypothetical protein